jgi:hypothetical protein
MTNHTVRVLALVPAARQAAVNTWVKNNLDPAGANWLNVGLNATGSGAPTHYIFNAALTVPQFKLLATQLLSMASLTLPANWDTLTLTEKFTWFRAQFTAIRTATGVRLRVFNNDLVWDNPQDELTAAGLKMIETPRG